MHMRDMEKHLKILSRPIMLYHNSAIYIVCIVDNFFLEKFLTEIVQMLKSLALLLGHSLM